MDKYALVWPMFYFRALEVLVDTASKKWPMDSKKTDHLPNPKNLPIAPGPVPANKSGPVRVIFFG